MNCLVTGGAGFIGSNLVQSLLKLGNQVRVVDNFSTGSRDNLKNIANDIEVVEADIRNFDAVKKCVDDIEVVFHEAALPSVPRSIVDPVTTNEVNVNGTLNVLQAARQARVRKVIFASSSSVYGDNPTLPKNEDMIPKPLSPYAVSKMAGEKYCVVFSKVYGLDTISLRYFNVFGPRQNPDTQYSAVIPKFIKIMLNDQHPTIYGDGEQSRDFTYVDNVTYANILAATVQCDPGVVLNCACQEQTTLNDVVRKINLILNKNIEAIYDKSRLGDIQHSIADIGKAKQILNYIPLVDFEAGLQRTIIAYQK